MSLLRIKELESQLARRDERIEQLAMWHSIETERADELEESVKMQDARIAKLEKDAARLGNTDDLPEDLQAQLSYLKVGASELEVLYVINDMYGGIANVDEILVGMYRKTGNVGNRSVLVNRLYRMTKAGHIESVKKEKGVYKTNMLSDKLRLFTK